MDSQVDTDYFVSDDREVLSGAKGERFRGIGFAGTPANCGLLSLTRRLQLHVGYELRLAWKGTDAHGPRRRRERLRYVPPAYRGVRHQESGSDCDIFRKKLTRDRCRFALGSHLA